MSYKSLNVISFSLYGSKRLYCEGALRNVELAPIHYPGWVCRFYLDDSVPHFYQTELAARGAQIVKVRKRALGPMYGRYWRFWVAADPDVSRFIVRDADSRLNARERVAVDEWIGSGKAFHLMRDSAYHKTKVLAGMWGGLGSRLRSIEELIDRWSQFDRPGQNDQFVSEVIFPLMRNDYICHDSTGYFGDGKSFPPHSMLTGTRFVGEIIDDDRPVVDIWRQSAEFENLSIFERERTERLHAEIDQLKVLLKTAYAGRDTQLEQLDALAERIEKYRSDISTLSSQNAALVDQSEKYEVEAAFRLDQIKLLTQESERLCQSRIELKRSFEERLMNRETEILKLKHSTSWRITKPLRIANLFARKIVARAL